MSKTSAGILLYRIRNKQLQVFLVHPGGPFWAKKDLGAWSIPKGEIEEGEEPLKVAAREFEEETGQELLGNFTPLQPIKQKGGKTIMPWTLEGDADENKIVSNTFEMEWPPKSGKMKTFPEIDRAAWFTVDEAKEKINPAQMAIIEELIEMISMK